jgi:hypothetical protein
VSRVNPTLSSPTVLILFKPKAKRRSSSIHPSFLALRGALNYLGRRSVSDEYL